VGEKFGRFVAEMWRNTTTDASRVDALAEAKHALDAHEEGERLFVREGRTHELFTEAQAKEMRGTAQGLFDASGLAFQAGAEVHEALGIREATKEEVEAFRERTNEEEKRFVIEGELRSLAEGEIDPAAFESRILNGLAEAPGQLAYMAQMKLPFGIGYALFYRGNVAMRTKELMSRGVPLHKARDMARWSSVFEGLVEMAEAKMTFGVVPGFLKKALNGPMKSLATRDVAKRAGTLFAAEYATQNLQEFAQDVSTLIMQDVAANDKDMPHTKPEHWGEFWESRLDTAVVLLPFAFLGTGLAVGVNDRAWASAYLEDRRIALANGFVPEVADQVATLAADGKVAESEALIREAWNDPQKREGGSAEQLKAIDEMRLEVEQEEARLIESGRIKQVEKTDTLLDDISAGRGLAPTRSFYEVYDEEGELVDRVSSREGALFLANTVMDREEARARKMAEEAAREERRKEVRAHPKFEEWMGDSGSIATTRESESPALLWQKLKAHQREEFAEFAGTSEQEIAESSWGKLPEGTRADLIGAFLDMQQAEQQWGKLSELERGEVAAQLPSARRDYNEGVAERTDWKGLPARTRVQLAVLLRDYEPEQKWENLSREERKRRVDEVHGEGGELGRPDAVASEQQQAEAQKERGKLLSLREFLFGENRQSVVTLNGTEFAGGDVGKLRFRIAEWYAKNDNAVVTVEGVGPVKLDVAAVEHSLSHGTWRQKIAAFAAVPDVLRKGEIIYREPLKGATNGDYIHIAAPVQIGERDYIVDVMVKADSNGSRMYLHDVILTEKLRQPASQGGAVAAESAGKHTASTGARVAEEVLRRIYAVKSDEGKSGSSDADLASPLNLRQPNAAATSPEGTPETKGKKPVSSTAVLNAIARVAEAVGRDKRSVNRVGRMRSRNALGTYNVGSGVTRIRTAGDTTTGAHELAHLIDDALWGRDFWKKKGLPVGHPIILGEGHWKSNALNLSDAARGELKRLGNDLYREGEPHNGYHSEGFAEFVRLWLTDEKQAREKAPNFSKFWEEQVLGKHKNLKKAVKAASALAHQYLAQGALARGIAGIVKQPSTGQKLVQGAKKEVSEFRKKWIEAGAAIEAFRDEAAGLRGDEGGKRACELAALSLLSKSHAQSCYGPRSVPSPQPHGQSYA